MYVQLLGVGTWSSLRNASLKELATRICSLLGIKFNVVLEKAVFRQTALAVCNTCILKRYMVSLRLKE